MDHLLADSEGDAHACLHEEALPSNPACESAPYLHYAVALAGLGGCFVLLLLLLLRCSLVVPSLLCFLSCLALAARSLQQCRAAGLVSACIARWQWSSPS